MTLAGRSGSAAGCTKRERADDQTRRPEQHPRMAPVPFDGYTAYELSAP